MHYAGPASCKWELWSISLLTRHTHNWRGKIQSLTVSHRLPLVQDSFRFICKWKSFFAFALPVPFQRSLHCLDCVWGRLVPFRELHGSLVLLLSLLLYPACRGSQGELLSSPHCTSQPQELGGIYGDFSRLLALWVLLDTTKSISKFLVQRHSQLKNRCQINPKSLLFDRLCALDGEQDRYPWWEINVNNCFFFFTRFTQVEWH